jgi:hypothetical protein
VSSLLGGLGDLAAKSGGEAIAFGLGFALGRALEPAGTAIVQEAWKLDPLKAPDAQLLAEGVAQGQVDEGKAAEWATEHGYGAEQFAAMVDIANTGPALGYAYQAWRRGLLTDAEFTTALKRTGLEAQWNAAMRGLHDELLDPGALATAIHRGIIAGQGLLIREPPLGAGKVPHVAQSDIDAIAEGAGHGITPERLRVLVGNTGLPLALGQMLQLLNRGEVVEDDVRRSIAQSNVRNEYMDVALSLRRHLLTPHEYVEARLRGWIDDGAMRAGAALSGMEPDDTDLMMKLSGRPLSWRQVFIGERRGGHYEGDTSAIDPAFLKALQESNIRPEWYALAWAQRYSYPSAFVLRQLVTSGELTGAEAEQILLYVGWEPTLAKKVAGRWAGSTTGAGKQETLSELEDEYAGGFVTEAELRTALELLGYTGHQQDLLVGLNEARRLKRWREKVVDAIAAAYLGFNLDDAGAQSELAEVNVTGEAATLLLALWGKQRRFTIRELTPAQVKKAHKSGLYSRDVALAALADLHYTDADAATFLDE